MITFYFNNASDRNFCIFRLEQFLYVKKFSVYICQNRAVFVIFHLINLYIESKLR